MKYDDGIKLGIQQSSSDHEIARKIYLCYPTQAFINNEEIAFDILNRVSTNFNIQFTNVQVVAGRPLIFQSKNGI